MTILKDKLVEYVFSEIIYHIINIFHCCFILYFPELCLMIYEFNLLCTELYLMNFTNYWL